MHAIIEDSGTQIKVAEGDILGIDRRDAEEGSTLTFDRVLLVGGDHGETIGQPYVDGASVSAEVLGEYKDDKIDVVKFKRRKGYRVKQGHRQRYLRVRITGITSG